MSEKEIVNWSELKHGPSRFYIAATDKGLCYLGSPNAPFQELAVWVRKKIPDAELSENRDALDPYAQELTEYLEGKRKEFSLKLDLRGTEFQLRVWRELLTIPFGQTATYTEIAQRIGREDAVRAVGTAIGANPVLIPVPCHRMLGKHGEWRGYRGGLEMKGQLLELEK